MHGSTEVSETSGTSWRDTMTDVGNMLKAFIGLNFMYVSYAFSKAGVLRGTIGLLLITLVTEHCCLLLIRVKDTMPPQPSSAPPPTYGDIAAHVGGSRAKNAVNAALVLTQFGYCVAYLIFLSQTTHDVLQSAAPVWMFVLVPLPVLAILALLRSIRSLGPFSLLANAALLVGFLAVVGFVLQHFRWAPSHPSWGAFPLFFGQITAALEGIGLVVPVESSMKDRSRFPFVLRVALGLLTGVLLVVGVLGFVTFGEDTRSILLLNFGQTGVVIAVKLFCALGILFTYPLQIIPVFQFVESILPASEPPEPVELEVLDGELLLAEDASLSPSASENDTPTGGTFITGGQDVAIRLAILLLTALTAILAGASFGVFAGFVGSLGASSLAYSAPALLHIGAFRTEMGRWELAKDVAIVIFGVAGMVIGTGASLWEMFRIHTGGAVPV